MRLTSATVVILALLGGSMAIGKLTAQVESSDNRIAMVDDCLPGDPGYTVQTGGCQLKSNEGDVPASEFFDLLTSPNSTTVIGHPAWRNEPSYLSTRAGRRVRVTNSGGRGHTFTKTLEFGGGTITDPPELTAGLTKADGCPASPANLSIVPPGGTIELTNLTPGLNKYQCCIHPWMRTAIRVQ